MPAPYDYTLGNVPNPADSFMQGLQRGVGIQQLDVQRQQQQLVMQAEAQKMEQQRARAAAMQALMDNPSPTADDYRKAMTAAPDLSEHLKRGWEVLNTEQQQSALNDAGQVYAALESGKPEYAIKSLRDRVDAMKTGGANPTQIKAVEDMASLIEMDPTTAKRSIGMRLATAPGGDKVMSALATLGGEQRNAAEAPAKLDKLTAEAKTAGVTAENAPAMAAAGLTKAQTEAAFAGELARLNVQRSRAEISNIGSQIADRSKRLALDERKLNVEIAEKLGTLPTAKLDAAGKKIVDEAVTASAVASQAASGMDALAAKFDTAGGGWGALSAGAELFKKATGTQGTMSLLRNEYVRLRNGMAIKSLPPGPATDRDIELALRGMPGENASSDVISSFLRGMAKMSRIESEVSSAKAEWVSSFGGLSAAKGAATVAGIPVQPGMKFEALAAQIGSKPAVAAGPPVAAPTSAAPAAPAAPQRNVIVNW